MSSRLLNLPTNLRNSLQGVYQTHRSSPLQNPPPIVGGPAIDHVPSLVINNCPRSPEAALASPGNTHARHQLTKVQIVSGYSRSRLETYFIGDTNTFKMAKKKRGLICQSILTLERRHGTASLHDGLRPIPYFLVWIVLPCSLWAQTSRFVVDLLL